MGKAKRRRELSAERPDPIAQMDQMAAALVNMAPPIAAFYKAMRKEGLTEREALYVIGEWVRALVQAQPPQNPEGGRE